MVLFKVTFLPCLPYQQLVSVAGGPVSGEGVWKWGQCRANHVDIWACFHFHMLTLLHCRQCKKLPFWTKSYVCSQCHKTQRVRIITLARTVCNTFCRQFIVWVALEQPYDLSEKEVAVDSLFSHQSLHVNQTAVELSDQAGGKCSRPAGLGHLEWTLEVLMGLRVCS